MTRQSLDFSDTNGMVGPLIFKKTSVQYSVVKFPLFFMYYKHMKLFPKEYSPCVNLAR